MRDLTDLQKAVLYRTIRAGEEYTRAASSGERVTLASLYRYGLLERKAWRGKEGGASAAYEYRVTAEVIALWEQTPT